MRSSLFPLLLLLIIAIACFTKYSSTHLLCLCVVCFIFKYCIHFFLFHRCRFHEIAMGYYYSIVQCINVWDSWTIATYCFIAVCSLISLFIIKKPTPYLSSAEVPKSIAIAICTWKYTHRTEPSQVESNCESNQYKHTCKGQPKSEV